MSQESQFPMGSQDSLNQFCMNMMGLTDTPQFTEILAKEPVYSYEDKDEGRLDVSKAYIPHQATINEFFQSLQAPQGNPSNPVSPDSQTGNITPTLASFDDHMSPVMSPHRHSPVPVLPSNADYSGPCGFEMTLGTPPKETKSTTWTYSENLGKLYCRIAVSCPFKFKTANPPAQQLYVRAMPIFMKPEHVQEIVKRCPNHIQSSEWHKDNVPSSHFVRCEHALSSYFSDNLTCRESVVVPLEQPHAGSEWVTNLYQFMCNNSCAGGINRRPVQVVFTLENDDFEVLGRKCMEVRVCACPGRDRKEDEKKAQPVASKMLKKPTKVTVTNQFMAVGPPAKKRKIEEEVFTVQVRGRENYEMICKIRDSLELVNLLPTAQLEDVRKKQSDLRKQNTLQRIASIPTGLPIQAQQFLPSSQGFGMHPSLSQEAQRLPRLPSLPSFTLFRNPGAGVEETDGGAVSSTSPLSNGEIKKEETPVVASSSEEHSVEEWLKKIKMTAYIDIFNNAGFKYMYQLDKDKFTLEDLDKMKIGSGHRNKIWENLIKYRQESTHPTKASQDLQKGASVASTISVLSQQSTGYCPGYMEVTRYTFRHSISLKQDHDYCKEDNYD